MKKPQEDTQVGAARVALAIVHEARRSRIIHGKFPTTHHALGVILEEFEELKDEIKLKEPTKAAMRKEAIQLAAACLHLVTDLCME